MAACGRPPTPAGHGIRSSTISPQARSARLRWRLPTRTLSTWAVGWEGPGSGLFKSTDGGDTWRQLTKGLPAETGRIGIAIAPSDRSRIYTQVDAAQGGTYRSNDAGESWERVNSEPRVWGRGS